MSELMRRLWKVFELSEVVRKMVKVGVFLFGSSSLG